MVLPQSKYILKCLVYILSASRYESLNIGFAHYKCLFLSFLLL